MNTRLQRCFGTGKDYYEHYHDTEWGIPSHDDRHLFELLCLEGAQAGLSWDLILQRREGYREVFHTFDPEICATLTDSTLRKIQCNPRIIRNRLKIHSVRKNAQAFLELQKEHGSFDAFLWGFVNNTPIQNNWSTHKEVPCESPLSEALSKALKKNGMSFVGPTIIYSYLQAVGVVNDHLTTCPCHPSNK